METVSFSGKSKYLKAFLSLPKRLYSKPELTQNAACEKQLLCGKHILSHYFNVTAFLVMDGKRPVARCIITLYYNEPCAYLGLFECIESQATASLLFNAAQNFCKNKGINRLIGPVDASFWIKYRLKTNRFGTPYACEPYNKPYYPTLFEAAFFEKSETYFSNQYSVIKADYFSPKLLKRCDEKLAQGYEIKSPNKQGFNAALCDIYTLLIKLYENFPAFKHISCAEFCEIFKNFLQIIDFNLTKIAYLNGVPVGFFVGIPNYGNLINGKITPLKLFRILRYKKNPKEYIMLYLGVQKGHSGLGGALSHIIMRQLKAQGASSIGALIQDGKVSGNFFKDAITDQYSYSLYKKNL